MLLEKIKSKLFNDLIQYDTKQKIVNAVENHRITRQRKHSCQIQSHITGLFRNKKTLFQN